MTNLGVTSDVKALRKIFNPDGLTLVDVGCGDGDLARKLAYVGATVIGVEPDSVQAQKNAQSDSVANVSFHQARASELPVEDQSVDGVMFSLSLHHVPQDEMQSSLDEALRVIKPTGFVAVIEPLLEGSYNNVIQLFHDETEVRTQAIEAIEAYAKPRYENSEQYMYTTESVYESFSVFASRYLEMTYNSFDSDVVLSSEVKRRFEDNRQGNIYVLEQPMRIDFFTNPK